MNRRTLAATAATLALAAPLTFPAIANAEPDAGPPHAALDTHGNGLCRALPEDTELWTWALTDSAEVVAVSTRGLRSFSYGVHPCYAAQQDAQRAEERVSGLEERVDRQQHRIKRLVAKVERLRGRR